MNIEKIEDKIEGRIESIEILAKATKKYRIRLCGKHTISPCFSVRLSIDNCSFTRPYTPVEWSDNELVLVIKIYHSEDHKTFTSALDECKEGDLVYIIKSRQTLLSENILNAKWKRIFMIGAGTGIAPMMQILFHATREKSKQEFILLSVNRTEADIIPVEIEKYVGINIRVENLLSKHKYVCREEIHRKIHNWIKSVKIEDTFYLVCGTDSFVEAVAGPRKGDFGGILQSLGILPSKCHKF